MYLLRYTKNLKEILIINCLIFLIPENDVSLVIEDFCSAYNQGINIKAFKTYSKQFLAI